MNIKSFYVNTTSSSINNNGIFTTGLSPSEIANKQIQIYPKLETTAHANNSVIRTIQFVNNGQSSIQINLYRKYDNNLYFIITKTVSAKQYVTIFSGYSVLNAGHQFFIKANGTNFCVNISLIQL